MMLKFCFYLFALIIVTGCDFSTKPDHIKSAVDFFPLAIGNSWVYKESFISPDTGYTLNYTAIITGVEEIGGYNWFRMEFIKKSGGKRFLMMENDSIYELQYSWQNPVRSLAYILPTDAKDYFQSIIGGDAGITKIVEKLDEPFHTEIGEFNNCLKYQYGTLDWTVTEILAPGIGIIEKEIVGYDLRGEMEFKRIEKIKDVKIRYLTKPGRSNK